MLIKKAKNSYYIDMLSKCEENVKKTLQRMKEITGKIKNKNKTFPKVLKINKKLIYSAEQTANEFNNSFFTNVGPLSAEKITPVSTNFTEYLISFNKPISNSDLTIEEFETAFKSLKCKEIAGIAPT